MSYDTFARRIVESGVLTDPWLDGKPRFRQAPLFVDEALARELSRASEDVAAVYNEMVLVVAEEPRLLEDFFGLTPVQRAMWTASEPHWHGLARADVFVTAEGLAFTEINCDTPTGEAEAIVLGRLAAEDHPGHVDPNAALEERFVAMVETFARISLDGELGKTARTIGLVYPTEFTEDLSLVRLYKRFFEARGYDVVLGSPYNLAYDEARGTTLFDTPVGIILRHYKTDWWSERQSVWDDDDLPDTEPLVGPLDAIFRGIAAGKTTVVNPFGAVLPQNKRAMAFFWEHLHRFSPHAQSVIQRYIPITSRLETMHEEQLAVQRADWVLKSDYGAEGDEVVIGKLVTDEVWRASLLHARTGRWIAQRYFEAETIDAAGTTVNHGVYLVGGEAAGLYARLQAGATDDRALSVPVLIRGAGARDDR